ncbi:MAG TPA: hypothetical protein VKF32_12790 [Thermoanaerobaculia bacterium]|nr:hypothetical protein [Thermoanaerobaculia bacterium]
MSTVQISAHISQATKRELERYAEAHGLKKGHLIEEALVHHLQALREIPDDVVVPVRIVLTPKSFARVSGLVKRPRKPTAAMRSLMKGTLKG